MTTQEQIISGLPAHLQPFVARQNYAAYTPRDQAVWRFLLHQLKHQLTASAHPTYLEGLARTGINLDRIPRIEEINQCLNNLGWQAVVVDGFLPPAVFMEFQALKVLVIAVNVRSFEHMLYTPAPDIVHEAAGHAPFLIDIDYAEFLQRFGELGMRAIANRNDIDTYEAVRHLSILKEQVGASKHEVALAAKNLQDVQAASTSPSEANLLARLHWWTVEYGLVGDTSNYKIYGAGLLSSLAESKTCLDDGQVIKKALTVDAIKTSYSITDPQPQLFVTESCRHLSQVLEEYGRHMCCQRGGASALQEAVVAASINTVQLNSGVQIAGTVSRVVCDAVGNAIYFNTSGPTQLAYQDIEIPEQGTKAHFQGFGSPIGGLRAFERCLSCYTIDELKRHGIEIGKTVQLNFLSGISVCGELVDIYRREQKNVLLSFARCTVQDADEQILFDPTWGRYDMAVGSSVESVRGGSADQQRYPLYDAPSEQATIEQDYDETTQSQFKLYAQTCELRESGSNAEGLVNEIVRLEDSDWLLRFEALELALQQNLPDKLRLNLLDSLEAEKDDAALLIKLGLNRVGC